MTTERPRLIKSELLFFLLLILLAAGSSVYVAKCTQVSPWGYSDSAAFFSAARNLAAGHGISVTQPNGGFSPLNLHAPLFSILLSIFVKFGADLINGGRILDVVFSGLFILLSGWLFYQISKKAIPSFCFALACAFSYPLASLFTSLMSEPLALVLGVPGFLALILGVKRDSLAWIAVGGILSGLALLTRFAFASISASGLLVILIFSRSALGKRFVQAIVFTVLSGLPMLVWTLIQRLGQTITGGREIILGADTVSKTAEFFRLTFSTLKYWFPYRTNMIPGVGADFFTPVLSTAFAAMIVAAFVVAIRRYGKGALHDPAFLLMCAFMLYVLSYFGVILVSFVFSSVGIDINARILAPIIPGILGLLVGSAMLISSGAKSVFARNAAPAVVALLFVVFNFIPLREYLVSTSTYPGGYASPAWKGKPIFNMLRQLPSDAVLVSNAPDVVLFYSNRYPYCLSEGLEETGCYSVHDLGRLTAQLEERCGAAVLFPSNQADQYENYPDPALGESMDGLRSQYSVFYSGDDGDILFLNQCALGTGG